MKPDQTAQPCRLIRVYGGRMCDFVGFVIMGSNNMKIMNEWQLHLHHLTE